MNISDLIKKLMLAALLILAPLLLFVLCFLCSSIVPASHQYGNNAVNPVLLSVLSVAFSELFLLVLNKTGTGSGPLITLSIATLFWMLYLMMDIRILLFLYPENTLNYQDLFQVSIIELTIWTTALLCRYRYPAHHQKSDR